MALLFMDGFDQYANPAQMLNGVWASIGSCKISTDFVRTGAKSLRSGILSNLRLTIPGSAKTAIGVGMACYFTPLVSCQLGRFLNDTLNRKLTIGVQGDGRIYLTDNANTELTTEQVIFANAWQHVEMFFDIANQTAEVRVDEKTVMSLQSLNISTSGNQNIGTFAFGYTDSSIDARFDDLFIWDTSGTTNNTFIGDKRVFMVGVTSDELPQDWDVEGEATGYAAIGTVTPNDATYIKTDPEAIGAKSSFGLTLPDPRITDITAIQTYTRQSKDDAGNANTQVSLDIAGQSATGKDRPITTANVWWTDVFETNPATGQAWTPTNINEDVKLTIKRTA